MTGKKVCGLMSPGTTKKCQQQHPLGLSDMGLGSKTPQWFTTQWGFHGTEGLTKIFLINNESWVLIHFSVPTIQW